MQRGRLVPSNAKACALLLDGIALPHGLDREEGFPRAPPHWG